MRRLLLMLPVFLAACNDMPTQPDPTPLFTAEGGGTVVTTFAEWQSAIATVQNGGRILIQGTVDIPSGEAILLVTANVTIRAATPGSGLRGVADAYGNLPECLVCLSSSADGATVAGLTLAGALDLIGGAFVASEGVSGVTLRDNRLVCDDPCWTHVFLANAPGATFADNVLMGHPSFSAIQIQMSPGARILNNWIEHAGSRGAIRNPDNMSAGLFVAHNTIASDFAFTPPFRRSGVIHTRSEGSRFVNNRMLELAGGPSCEDFSVGTGTAGTANQWVANQALVASTPAGICGAIP